MISFSLPQTFGTVGQGTIISDLGMSIPHLVCVLLWELVLRLSHETRNKPKLMECEQIPFLIFPHCEV